MFLKLACNTLTCKVGYLQGILYPNIYLILNVFSILLAHCPLKLNSRSKPQQHCTYFEMH